MEDLKAAHAAYVALRQDTVARAARAQHAAKRAVFDEARTELAAIAASAADASRLASEGSYRAALEETAEAIFTLQLADDGEISTLEGMDEETQIGGVCDAIGEVVRLMVIAATAGDAERARTLKTSVDRVMDGLIAMDFQGYLRTKFDQARSHMRHAEDVLYDLSLRGK